MASIWGGELVLKVKSSIELQFGLGTSLTCLSRFSIVEAEVAADGERFLLDLGVGLDLGVAFTLLRRSRLTRASGFAGRAVLLQLAMRARVAVRAVAFHLAMRARVAVRAVVFHLAMRARVAVRALVLHLAMRAGVAVRALVLHLAVRTRSALHALVLLPAMRTPLLPHRLAVDGVITFPPHVRLLRAPRRALAHAE